MTWQLLYESVARLAEVLALDVEDLDLPNLRARMGPTTVSTLEGDRLAR